MKRWFGELVLRGAALFGLGMSVLLIAEYGDPLVCTPGGGCDLVRHSKYAVLLGIPLPFLGALFFSAVFCLAVVPIGRKLLLPLGVTGALAGVAFTGIQAFVLKAFCPLCLVVDAAALLIGVIALARRGIVLPNPGWFSAAAQFATLFLVTVGVVAWHANLAAVARVQRDAQLPAVVLREQKPNLVTVVEFVDFECPACRAQYGEFRSVFASYADKLNVVMKQLPLPQHQDAATAARAFCCAEENGAAAAMADKLFTADSLRPEDCERIAIGLGLDRDEFRRCVDSDRVTERLHADRSAAAAVEVHGLPTFWIGHERFEGVHDSDSLRDSIDRALQQVS